MSNDDVVSDKFDNVIQTLTTFKKSITELQNQIKVLEKTVKKEIKVSKKERASKNPRKPSGFAKPSKVSDELCKFMNKDAGSEMARTEVTQYIIGYIKDNSLQYEENKKIIIPDTNLKSLLNIKEDEELTYFNLQKYMNKHFI